MLSREQIERKIELHPGKELDTHVRSVLNHAIDAYRRGLKVYQSLQNLNEVIGTEYGDRVLYELIQNAHDAHEQDDKGQIAIKLVVQSNREGILYIANGGNGFRPEDVEAIKNLAISAKGIGEGIGNKGLGFRSIEALTDDVRIYSRQGTEQKDRFDGYCFRFATVDEIEDILLRSFEVDTFTSREIAKTIPRYLVPLRLEEQPSLISEYARQGYATVIVSPLRTPEAVALASKQVSALADLDVPLLLFLNRIAEIKIDVENPQQENYTRLLTRRQSDLGDVPSFHGARMYEVDVGENRRFLVVRREVDKERILAAVKESIPTAPQLKRWLNWKGQPLVSVAVALSKAVALKGRLYNFLPMGEEAASPLIGYLDAPFFADIDRRDVNLDLPLNEMLIEAAAETCAAAVLSIVGNDIPVPAQAVFDLFAWTREEAGKLDDALKKTGNSLREARVIPVIAERGKRAWSSLSDVNIWPEGSFKVLKKQEVAKHVGAQLVSNDLDSRRIDRLKELAWRHFRRLTPSGRQLSDWVAAFAQSLLTRRAATQTWAKFYDDIPLVFKASEASLKMLDEKIILYDQTGKLRPTGGHNGAKRVFVRSAISKSERKKKRQPLPPATLARRYWFLNDRILLHRETLDAFKKAGLVHEYDPVEALAGLKSALGTDANQKRRQEALIWAFQVWRSESKRVEDKLQEADLYVPTLSGWHLAKQTAFSSSWTPVGKILENYLIEAAEISADCQRARDLLLIGPQNWPASVQDMKRDWIRFLEVIGVADGLRPIPTNLRRKGTPSNLWGSVLLSGKPAVGLDQDWCAEVARISFNHPYTDYTIRGEGWRIPGQIEHEQLTESAKEALCHLIFEHLKAKNSKFFQFEIGRFERQERAWDKQILPTPLATFLRSKPWIATITEEGTAFKSPKKCWASRIRRGTLPKFIDRIPEQLVEFSEDELANLAFSSFLGIRDWLSQETALERLRDLARVSIGLPSNNRPALRREYQRAWKDVVETGISLPSDLELIVTRRGQLEHLSGTLEIPTEVIITEDAQRFEARILSSSGQAVLEIGSTSTDRIATLLEGTSVFVPRCLNGMGVKLMVDGKLFLPSFSDPLLSTLGMSWLPEIIIIGHELRGKQLEQGIQTSTIERRARSIRVRRCEAITLSVDNAEVYPAEKLKMYAVEHDELPTLILTNDFSLNWMTLARSLSGGVSRLIDSRLQSLEPILLRLALDRSSDELNAPSNEDLARALDCDVQTIQDHRAALLTELEHVLHLLLPLAAYFGGRECSEQLKSDIDRAGTKFDVLKWLKVHLSGLDYSPEELVEACEQATTITELHKILKLNFERFNLVLLEIGEIPLSNEKELKQLYDGYIARMRPLINERLRRHYFADFQAGKDLRTYAEQKSLDFLSFNEDWILKRETLEMEFVETYVSDLLTRALGDDVSLELAPFKRVVEQNRKSVREFALEAKTIIQIWCKNNKVTLPEPWSHGEVQSVVRHVENSGLLDFEIIKIKEIPSLCGRASCWPTAMPKTIDTDSLGLDMNEVKEEEKRSEEERQRKEIAQRSIVFAGRSLDTGDQLFAGQLTEMAASWLAKDSSWLDRSLKRIRLANFENSEKTTSSSSVGGRSGGARRREIQLTDSQRKAMGLAGEWLAYQFLLHRHKEFVDETCWISENRAQLFGGVEGDDSAGFDFLVKTPKTEWLYEVKSSMEDSGEFELTANELRVASSAWKDGSRRYRILYVPYVFSPDKWHVLELPNPMGEATRNKFTMVRRGAVRLRFERK